MTFRAERAFGKMAGRPLAIRAAPTLASIIPEHDADFQDQPERRWLVPALAGVAVALALAVLAVVTLYATGFFGRGPPSTAVATAAATPAPATPPQPAGVTTAVPQAIVAAPADEPPVRSRHGDWQIRCDTPPGAA